MLETVFSHSSSFRVFEAGWLYDSFPFLYTVLCVFIEHCEILWAALVRYYGADKAVLHCLVLFSTFTGYSASFMAPSGRGSFWSPCFCSQAVERLPPDPWCFWAWGRPSEGGTPISVGGGSSSSRFVHSCSSFYINCSNDVLNSDEMLLHCLVYCGPTDSVEANIIHLNSLHLFNVFSHLLLCRLHAALNIRYLKGDISCQYKHGSWNASSPAPPLIWLLDITMSLCHTFVLFLSMLTVEWS